MNKISWDDEEIGKVIHIEETGTIEGTPVSEEEMDEFDRLVSAHSINFTSPIGVTHWFASTPYRESARSAHRRKLRLRNLRRKRDRHGNLKKRRGHWH